MIEDLVGSSLQLILQHLNKKRGLRQLKNLFTYIYFKKKNTTQQSPYVIYDNFVSENQSHWIPDLTGVLSVFLITL